MMDGKCTVFFEDPYWVAVFERRDADGYSVARFVFGSEPSEAALIEFANVHFLGLPFSQPGPAPEDDAFEIGFKRRLRLARQQMNQEGVGTLAQRALQAERERMKQVRQEESSQAREARERQKFLLKQAQKKEKQRGH